MVTEMGNLFKDLTNSQAWQLSVSAATKALTESGYKLKRLPGRGRSNVYEATKGGRTTKVSIRTTKGRRFAFPSTNKGKAWLTLDDVDTVVVAAVNERDDPTKIQVYEFDASEVRKRFSDAYAARVSAGMSIRDNFGLWVGLDRDDRDIPRSVGTGLGDDFPPIAEYLITDLVKEVGISTEHVAEAPSDKTRGTHPKTIAEIVAEARLQIADVAGVDADAVRLDLKIEY